MKLLSSLLVVGLLFTGCAGKAKVGTGAEAQSILKANQYVVALHDFQDGVSAGFYSGYLGASQTVVIAQALSVAVDSIHASPSGARSVVNTLISDLKKQLSQYPDAVKYTPYLDSLAAVIGVL